MTATTVLTSDSMRKVVEEEGLGARNLLNWNVIVKDKGSLEVPKTSKKLPSSPRPQSASPKPPIPPKDVETRISKSCPSLRHPKSRVRSSSAGRNPEKGLRARYWAFLFENLYRAVDEIYQTCEMDESIVESKEAIMMLENYCKEFQALIQWLNISKNYEVTSPPNRPTSLAWEVRKSLPSKGILKNAFLDKIVSGNGLRKKLDIHGELVLKTAAVQTEVENSGICDNNVVSDDIKKDIAGDINNVEKCDISTNAEICIQSSNSGASGVVINNDENNHFEPETIVNNSAGGNIIASSIDVSNSDKVQCIKLTVTEAEKAELIKKCEMLNEVEISAVDVLTDDIKTASDTKKIEIVANGNAKTEPEIININGIEFGSETCINVTDEKEVNIISSCEVNDNNNSAEDSNDVKKDGQKDFQMISQSVENSASVENDPSIKHLSVDTLNSNSNVSILQKGLSSEKTVSANAAVITSETKTQTISADADESVSIEFKPMFSDIGVQTVPVSVKSPTSTSAKNVINSKTRSQVDTKDVTVAKKISTVSQNVKLATKSPATVSVAKTVIQNTTTTATAQIREVSKRLTAVPSRLTKSSSNLSPAPKPSVTSGPVKPMVQRKTVTTANGPLHENRPFRTGNYEPKIRRASHVVTNPDSYRKFGAKMTSTVSGLSHVSRPSQHHMGKDASKSDLKSGSTSSLSSTSSIKSWVGKVREGSINADDADGWETVRGRTRCKNSPAKKVVTAPNTIDTAVAAKLSQSKMGGFPYTCTSNCQITKASNTLQKAKSTEDFLERDDTAPEQTSRSNAKMTNSPLQMKSPDNDKKSASVEKLNVSSKASISKLSVEASRNKKRNSVDYKPNVLSCYNANEKSKNGSLLKSGKNVPKNTHLQRHLSTDNIEGEKAPVRQPQSNTGLRKSYSSCSIDFKRKEKTLSKTSNNAGEITKNVIKRPIDNKVTKQDCKKTKYSEKANVNNITEKRDEQSVEIKDSVTSSEKCIDLSVDSQDQVDSNSETQKTSESDSKRSSDLDEGLVSDDGDGITSQDEGLTDAQELELYEKMIQEEAQEHISSLGLSWGDQMDLLDMELRTPGRALQMHEKLSSPFRKRPLSETIRLHAEKQLKAQEQRERLLEEKAQRFKDIQKKVEEMKAFNEKKQERQRIILEQKLQRAEEKRKKQIEMIVRKAHDEEEKVNEIAFINTLEAQNKRHDLISKEKDHEARLLDIQEERQRKLDEKAAKEAAAEERRKVLEAERQARLLEMQEKRKLRDLKIEQQLMEKEKERQEMANQKARERELRISALNAAQQATVEELQKKIQLKQEESARRHEENMELIRHKAFELSVRRYSSNNDDAPQLVPYETKKICTICNVLIGSEVYLLSHLRGKKHQAMITDRHQGHDPSTEELELYNLKHIVDASTDQLDPNIAFDKERQKALKKRCKKLRQKLEKRGSEFEKCVKKNSTSVSSQQKKKLEQVVDEVKTFVAIQNKRSWAELSVNGLEKIIADLKPLIKKLTLQDKNDFRVLDGINLTIELLHKLLVPGLKSTAVVPSRIMVQLFETMEHFFKNCIENSMYVLMNNKVGASLDILSQRLNVLIPDNFSQILVGSSPSNCHLPPVDEMAGELMHFVAFVLNDLSTKELSLSVLEKSFLNEKVQNINQQFDMQITDVVSYVVSIGIVDRLSQYFNNVRGPVDFKPEIAVFLRHSLTFLTALMKLYYDSYDSILERKKMDDPTQLMATLKVTDLVGAVSLLYCILLHDGSSPVQETAPSELPEHTILVALAALRMLNQIAVMNLHLVQSILGSEGLSLQLRHISSYLLWYCSHWNADSILHELILLLGYFTVSNLDNQALIQAGQCPTVLQQLCALPFNYFSNPKQTEILFPTLLACSYNNECNRAVLQQEMAIELLSTYLESQLLDGYSGLQIKTDPNVRWRLHTRFPKYRWSSAKTYFMK